MADIKIIFHQIAKEDLENLYNYFSKYSQQYADSFLQGLFDFIKNLSSFPKMGRKYPQRNEYRQIIYQNYRIIYKFIPKEDKIIITTIVHCSRKFFKLS